MKEQNKQSLVPFGKYKDKPVEVLQKDPQYVEWMLSQAGLKNRYPQFMQVVINNFREPDETPEHNKLQIKFQDPEYRLKFAYACVGEKLFYGKCSDVEKQLQSERRTYVKNALVNFFHTKTSLEQKAYLEKRVQELWNKHIYPGTYPLISLPMPDFEVDAIDVKFSIGYGANMWKNPDTSDPHNFYGEFVIEIKPVVSDDYPAVLRQLRSLMAKRSISRKTFKVLFLSAYTGEGASREQFIDFFRSQGYEVIFESDVDNIIPPQFDRELPASTFDFRVKEFECLIEELMPQFSTSKTDEKLQQMWDKVLRLLEPEFSGLVRQLDDAIFLQFAPMEFGVISKHYDRYYRGSSISFDNADEINLLYAVRHQLSDTATLMTRFSK